MGQSCEAPGLRSLSLGTVKYVIVLYVSAIVPRTSALSETFPAILQRAVLSRCCCSGSRAAQTKGGGLGNSLRAARSSLVVLFRGREGMGRNCYMGEERKTGGQACTPRFVISCRVVSSRLSSRSRFRNSRLGSRQYPNSCLTHG